MGQISLRQEMAMSKMKWIAPLLALLLAACGGPLIWDDKRECYVSTDKSKQEQRQEIKNIERRLDKIEKCKHENC